MSYRMKSAQHRAEDSAEAAGLTPSSPGWLPLVDTLRLSFEEHATDQRHLCADDVAALDTGSSYSGTAGVLHREASENMRYDAHAAVMNAPAPGQRKGDGR